MPGYSTAIRNGRLNADLTIIGSAAKLQIYGTPRPATGGAVGAAVKLSEHVCGSPFAPAAAGGVQTANAIAAGVGLATGTAVWARLVTSADVFVADYSAGLAGTGQEVSLTGTATIATGQTVNVSSFTRTAGNP